MNKKFKLTIGSMLTLRVKGFITDGPKPVAVEFKATAKRVDSERYRATFGKDSEVLGADFLREVLTGWSDQKLVTDEDGQPADFCPEALDALLQIVGIEAYILRAYVDAISISDTQKGRAGN